MIAPDFLKVGDKVGIVAPARSVRLEELETCIGVLNQWGLEVVLGKHLFNVFHQFAGKDHHRAEDFQSMLDNPEISAIFCARGGY